MSSSSLSKRKLDDYYYADHSSPTLADHPITTAPARRRKDQTTLTPTPDPTRFQFFVRMLSDPTLVLLACSTDTVRSVHERIQSLTGMPIMEQRLIYRGKQLQWEQTLHECGVQRDAELNLVGRMRSTGHPYAWQLMNDVVSFVMYLYKNNDPSSPPSPIAAALTRKTIQSTLHKFLDKTPRTDIDQAAGHLQVFTTSSAAQALVMLYVSCNEANREAADDAIRQFVASSQNVLPKDVHHQCAPIVLEFCKLLRRAVGCDDPLYVFCRSSLGAMEVFDEGREKKCLIGIHDAFPFVRELAVKLSRDLMVSMESVSLSGPSSSDVRDFAAFSAPLMREMRGSVVWMEVHLIEELSSSPVGYVELITYFNGVFLDLLDKSEKCLVKVEEQMESGMKHDFGVFAWCQYLAVLKVLNSISKVYYGCKELFWETMKRRKSGFCYLIVKFAKGSDDTKWILEGKQVTNFEARRHLALLMLPEVKNEFEELHEMLIDRSHLLAESFQYIANADTGSLRAGLFTEFKNEEATGPGVLREWFVLVCQEIFNPQNALFVACPNDRRRFFPNPASKVDRLHLEYFRFCGRVIALSLMHKIHIGIVLDRSFVLQLAGHGILLEDIRDADPYLYNSCKQILEMDAEAVDQDALGLTFVHEIEEFGTRKVVELCVGGRSMAVDSVNRKYYVDSLIEHRFVTAISEQVEHFARGFSDIANWHRPEEFFRCLEPEDLDLMLHGSENPISVDDWRAHTNYHGFKETDSQISWFWKSVGLMTQEQKKVLLFFWTSIKYLPVEGFGGLASRLYIYKTSQPSDRLPSSHTCFYRLCFPSYPSLSVTRDRLSIITQEHVGCSFGTW